MEGRYGWTTSFCELLYHRGSQHTEPETCPQAGIFSAIVTAFIIEGYKSLKPDFEEVAAALLIQISQQLPVMPNSTVTSGDAPPSALELDPFRRTSSALRVSVLWFLSVVLSLYSALAATLVKQWARNLQRQVGKGTLEAGARPYSRFYRAPLEIHRLSALVHTVQNLLHISVFLFLGGLFDFLLQIYAFAGYVILGVLSLGAGLYLTATIVGTLSCRSPYQTPLSAFFRCTLQILGLQQSQRSLNKRALRWLVDNSIDPAAGPAAVGD